ncbi:MAG TPA: putative lipid II flippase FtsW [Clostridia bacterium]|nr:putative lipid II flippase FtsW [Clostridia bacterium]HRX41689.1 putative lipid II flippase FtsW [Clostridia bacterium]
MKEKRAVGHMDFFIIVFTLILIAIGLVMVFSASTPAAKNQFNDIYHYLKQQLVAFGIGFIAMVTASFISYKVYRKYAYIIYGIALLLICLVLIPGIGTVYNDARRWITIGGFDLQPSEIYKFAIIVLFARLLTEEKIMPDKFFKGYLLFIGILGVSAFLLIMEPHLSGTIIVMMLGLVLLFIGGAKLWHLALTVVVGGAGLAAVSYYIEYMWTRVVTWLDPFAYAQGEGYQVVQSLYAIGSGGLLGQGAGKSMQKFLYIPEPQNDFIFAILAEELGFLGVAVVIILFFLLLYRGIKTAADCEDKFGGLLATGITSLIFIQAVLNIAVVTGSVPATGISLPFFSAGGTGLVMFMGEIGILLNISRLKGRGTSE